MKKIIAFFLVGFLCPGVFGQTVSPPEMVEVFFRIIEDSLSVEEEFDPFAEVASDQAQEVVVVVGLSDTTEVAELHFAYRNCENDSLIFQDSILYDEGPIINGNITYERQENLIYLNFGAYQNLPQFSCLQVRIRDLFGDFSPFTEFSNQQ